MLNNLKEQIYDRVERHYHQRVGISRIQEMISNSLKQEVPLELIREIISEIKEGKKNTNEIDNIIIEETKELEKKDGGLKALVNDVGDDKLYDYNAETDQIIFYPPNSKPHAIIRTTVLAMFEKYSKDGEGLSGKQMQQEFQLTPKVRQFIKRVMDLYKDSIPFDKVTLSLMNPDDMEDIAKKKAERLTESKMKRIFDKSLESSVNSALRKVAIDNGKERKFLENLENALKLAEPIDVKGLVIPKPLNKKIREVAMADLHMGKTGTDGIVIRVGKVTRDLVACDESIINITFLGDLGECFLPYSEMHIGQRLGMEDIGTADLMNLIVKTITEMLLTLYKAGKIVTFNGMGGNHDRFTERKEFDPNNEPALAIYYWIKSLVENTNIRINILKQRANVIKSGRVKYIYLHGDELNEKELLRRAINEIENGFYLIFITADKHHFKSQELADRVLWVQTTALAGAGRYDKKLGLSSLPGILETRENDDGMVDFTVKRYK